MLQSRLARLGAVFLVAAIVVVLLTGQGAVKGADATAIWLAGRAFAEGQFDQIYNVDRGLFTMTPPSGWAARLAEQGISDQAVYPFVYPPLWAWFAAHVLPGDLMAYLSALQVVNAACLMFMAGISWRICGRGLTPLSGVAIAVGIMISLPISLGVVEIQPQIFVSLVILLALERHLSGADKTSGALLALAAAIKLYPALFAFLLLARRRWSGVASFVVIGGALGLSSIAVAGWPLHEQFLQAVGGISDTVLLTGASPNFNAAIANLFFMDQMSLQAPIVVASDLTKNGTQSGDAVGWYLMARPAVWAVLQNLALLGLLGNSMWLVARAETAPITPDSPEVGERVVAVWAAFSVGLVLIAPLSWFYYYIMTIFLQPVLFRGLPSRWAFAATLIPAFLMSPLVYGITGERYSMVNFGVLAGLIWMLAFLRVCWPTLSLPRSARAARSSG